MSALSADKLLRAEYPQGQIPTAPKVKASQTIYEGAVVSENTGAVPHSGTLAIYGIAQARKVTTSSVTDFDAVQVFADQIVECSVAGSPAPNAIVYVATDNVDDATTTSSGASRLGTIVSAGIFDTTKWRVKIAPAA